MELAAADPFDETATTPFECVVVDLLELEAIVIVVS